MPLLYLSSIPYECTINAKYSIVGYCLTCHVIDPIGHPGTTCPEGHEWEEWAYKKYGHGSLRRLRARRMWKCTYCEFWYPTRNALLEHEHEYL